jgi:hypothetical protein
MRSSALARSASGARALASTSAVASASRLSAWPAKASARRRPRVPASSLQKKNSAAFMSSVAIAIRSDDDASGRPSEASARVCEPMAVATVAGRPG